MRRTFLPLSAVVLAFLTPRVEAAPVPAGKTTAKAKSTAKPAPAKTAQPAAAEPAPVASTAPAPSPEATGEEPLDVTITGEAKDDIVILKDPPPLDLPFKDLIPLSRENQREKVLANPVVHMTADDVQALTFMDARQTVLSLPVQIPEPPFFRVPVPPGVGPGTVCELQVFDQEGQLFYHQDKAATSGGLVTWDGAGDPANRIAAGKAYTPVLILHPPKGSSRRHFGDPVQLDVLQFPDGRFRRVEFAVDRLFAKGSADFDPAMTPSLMASADLLRRSNESAPARIALQQADPQGTLAQRRLAVLKKYYMTALGTGPDAFEFAGEVPGARGEILSVTMGQ
jgi:hypothetical protein